MLKRQLIEGIQQLNPTAQPQFLSQFDEKELQAYLDRLRSTRQAPLQLADPAAETTEVRAAS